VGVIVPEPVTTDQFTVAPPTGDPPSVTETERGSGNG